ncbi:MAG: YdiU family protein [Pseudomonadota bacterium]
MPISEPPPFLSIAHLFADAVEPADFPDCLLRFRNTRWDELIGFGEIDDAQWAETFSRFPVQENNLPQPLATRYHGHQFGVYNPDLGDGRGFLYAQFKTDDGRWLDLGTKGTGQTPWSRQGDGRLTLKGGLREVLASEYLEALGVRTSKAFSLVETGEALYRNDEPSPARSAVLVRLQHSHIRFGTFQRAAYHDDRAAIAALVEHTISTYHRGAADPELGKAAPALLQRVVDATARMIGQWMAAGFVHGVMNTDNFNVTGETFDFGPYRFLPYSDPNFVAAYFDHTGLYRFGRQPTQGLWALQQLAGALAVVAEADDLVDALRSYEPAYQRSFADQTLALLGLEAGALDNDLAFLSTLFGWMTESAAPWPQLFFDWFGGDASAARAAESPIASRYDEPSFKPIRDGLAARTPDRPKRLEDPYFQRAEPASLLVGEIEALWSKIADQDDWSGFDTKLADFDSLRRALSA